MDFLRQFGAVIVCLFRGHVYGDWYEPFIAGCPRFRKCQRCEMLEIGSVKEA